MADSIAGYPTGPLERFVTGFQTGYSNMTEMRKNSDNLQTQLLANEQFRNAAKNMPSTSDDGGSGTGRQKSFVDSSSTSDGTTGSGGGGGGGGGGIAKWGDYAAPIIDFFTKAGYKPAAIQGIMANGLAEGGFASNWVAGDNGASRGHWQFNSKGEMPGYEKWARDNGVDNLQDSVNQARYVDYRMNQINPNFKNLEDARVATNQFHTGFEKPKDQTPGLRFPQLAIAQKYMAGPMAGTGTSTAPVANVGQTQAPAAATSGYLQPTPTGGYSGADEVGPASTPAPAPRAAAGPPVVVDGANVLPPGAKTFAPPKPALAPSGLRPPAPAGGDVYSSAEPPTQATFQTAALQSTPRGQSDVALGPQGGEFPPYSAGYPDQVIGSSPNPYAQDVHHTLYPGSRPPALTYPQSGKTNPFLTPEYGWQSSPTNPVIEDRPPQIPPGWSETRGPQSAYRPRRRRSSRSY